MDAYSNYILRMTNARVGELRREAAEFAMSQAARRSRASWWRRVRGRLRIGRPPVPEQAGRPVTALTRPQPVVAEDLRRSA